MASGDPRSSGGFVRALVAVTASLSLIGGLVVAATAVRWYSLRTVGVVNTTFVPTTGAAGTSYPTGSCSRPEYGRERSV